MNAGSYAPPPAADRLHETGCVLCGYFEATLITSGPGYGHKTCIGCDTKFRKPGELFGCGNEILRRKASAPAETIGEFKVGDWIETTASETRHVGKVTKVGDELVYFDLLASPLQYQEFPNKLRAWTPQRGECCEGTNVVTGETNRGSYEGLNQHTQHEQLKECGLLWQVKPGTLRPAAPPAPTAAKLLSCVSCGTELGAGQISRCGAEGCRVPAPTAAKGDPVRSVLAPPICGDCKQPITNPLDACKRTRKVAGGVVLVAGTFHRAGHCPHPAKLDPYLASNCAEKGSVWGVTDIKNKDARGKRIAALSASENPLDRLAAKRARHVAELKGELGREVVPRAPWDWPGVEDGEIFTRVRKIGDV